MRIALIGYRATGKSTTGPAVARTLDWSWCDSDEEVERRAGTNIAQIFSSHGELAFRDLEAEVIRELTERPRIVLSVGGGAILRETNRELLRRGGMVFWLKAGPAEILRRMRHDVQNDSRRPRLTNLPAAEEIRQQLAIRDPMYASVADACFDTESQDTPAIVTQIVAMARQRWPDREPVD